MPKKRVLVLVLLTIILTSFFTIFSNNTPSKKTLSRNQIDTAINQASHIYREQKEKGRDFSDGPCLSNALLPDWVVDIVHEPRQPSDDLPENQCPGYAEGRVKYLLELDTDGNFVRVK